MTSTASWRHQEATGTCPICGAAFVPASRQRFCSSACRQAAWRRRQPVVPPMTVPASRASRRASTVYECPSCELRLVGEQRCPECQIWARRLGPGGVCPHCDEPVTLADLGLEQLSPGGSHAG